MSSGNPRDCIMDIASALKHIFTKYTRGSRKKAWSTITSSKGKSEIQKLLINPQRKINVFRNISFREWAKFKEELMDELNENADTEYPPSIASLVDQELDDLTPEELLHLSKWYGIVQWEDFEHLKNQIRKRKMNRPDHDAPSPDEVRMRMLAQLMKQGKLGGKWRPKKAR